MASLTFKVGDRVYWPGNRFTKRDTGIVTTTPAAYAMLSGCNIVWVKRDSDGKVLHIRADDLERFDGLFDI